MEGCHGWRYCHNKRQYRIESVRQANSTLGAGHAHTPVRPDYPGSLGSKADLDLVGTNETDTHTERERDIHTEREKHTDRDTNILRHTH